MVKYIEYPNMAFDYVKAKLPLTVISWIIDYRFRTKVAVKNQLKFWMDQCKYDVNTLLETEILNSFSEEKRKDYDAVMYACFSWVRKNIKYVSDTESKFKTLDYWQSPIETLQLRTGDCFAGYEKVYTKTGTKRIDTLEVDDEILSYDFKKKKYVYKPIIKFWSKGNLQVNRVHFRNGQHIDVSDDHPMWARTLQKNSSYSKVPLSDIDLDTWWKRKVPCVKKLPYKEKDIRFMTEDLCFLYGYFLAEGSIRGNRIEVSGYNIPDIILPILEKHDLLQGERVNNSGVPIAYIKEGTFANLVLQPSKGEKSLSFSAHIPEELFRLPERKLQKIIEGYLLGDGTKNVGKNQYSKEYVLSTSSEQLAKDFCRIGLQLGRPHHCWKQVKHGGVGTKPIWRLTYNPQSHFSKDFGYTDASEVSISYIEKMGKVPMYDLTVKDTHTVVMENGIITHQCEDGSILMYCLARHAGIPENRLFIMCGDVLTSKGKEGHAYLCYKPKINPLVFHIMDWCYFYDNSMVGIKRPAYFVKNKKIFGGINKYLTMWFAFSENASYSDLTNKV